MSAELLLSNYSTVLDNLHDLIAIALFAGVGNYVDDTDVKWISKYLLYNENGLTMLASCQNKVRCELFSFTKWL